MPQGLRGPHALGHAPAQRVIGVLAQLLAGRGAAQATAGEHVGELALCVVRKVLRFVVAGFLGCEVAVAIPGIALGASIAMRSLR